MSLFRRKPPPEARQADPETGGTEDAQPVEEPGASAALDRSAGPYDAAEVDDDVPRLDLGALHVPPRPGMELRLELEDATKRVVAATVGLAGSSLQLQAFAAPRTEGVWDEIRTEIAAQVAQQGGAAEEVTGTFGCELVARLPMRTGDGRTAERPVRFVGVDGPRWFLRGVFSGPAASAADAAEPLEEVLRGTVVVRGTDAMAPRDLLPLKLPAAGQSAPAPPSGEPA